MIGPMRHLILRLLAPLTIAASVAAAEPVTGDANGAFDYAGIRFGLLVQGAGLIATSATVQPAAGWPKQNGATWETHGSIPLSETKAITVEEKLTTRDDGTCDVDLRIAAPEPLKMQNVALIAELPVAEFAGKSLAYDGGPQVLPNDISTGGMLPDHWKSGLKTITVPVSGHPLTISGDLACSVADERAWGQQRFGLRLLCARPDPQSLTTATLHCHLATAAK
jgi:hypothetical protein